MLTETWPQQNADVCAVAGHAWQPKRDEHGAWEQCVRCGSKRSVGWR